MKKINKKHQYYLKGYAQALQDILKALTGDNTCNKSYDPITIDKDKIYSYAFRLKKGGRTHELKDFNDVEDIKVLMCQQIANDIELWVASEKTCNAKDTTQQCNRIEVINSKGRVYTNHNCKDVILSWQDNNETLKIFFQEQQNTSNFRISSFWDNFSKQFR